MPTVAATVRNDQVAVRMHPAESAGDVAVTRYVNVILRHQRRIRHKADPAFQGHGRAAVRAGRVDDNPAIGICAGIAILPGSRRIEIRNFDGSGAAGFLIIDNMHSIISARNHVVIGVINLVADRNAIAIQYGIAIAAHGVGDHRAASGEFRRVGKRIVAKQIICADGATLGKQVGEIRIRAAVGEVTRQVDGMV